MTVLLTVLLEGSTNLHNTCLPTSQHARSLQVRTARLICCEGDHDPTDVPAARQATILPAASEGARVPTAGGATQRLQDDAQNGLASGVLAAPPADARLTSAALFIDQNAQQLGPMAALK